MFRPRVIPVLLLRNGALCKSIKFTNYNYIGDPINAVKILSSFLADEIVILDIDATIKNRVIDCGIVRDIAHESTSPFSVGGGIDSLNKIERLLKNGADKVVLNSSVLYDQRFLKDAVRYFGSSTITVCVDLKKNIFGHYKIYCHGNGKTLSIDYLKYLHMLEDSGPGELIVQSVDLDGTMNGYDNDLYRGLSQFKTPILALGGAGSIAHIIDLQEQTSVNGFCGGSMFLYYGTLKSVLINYKRVTTGDFRKKL